MSASVMLVVTVRSTAKQKLLGHFKEPRSDKTLFPFTNIPLSQLTFFRQTEIHCLWTHNRFSPKDYIAHVHLFLVQHRSHVSFPYTSWFCASCKLSLGRCGVWIYANVWGSLCVWLDLVQTVTFNCISAVELLTLWCVIDSLDFFLNCCFEGEVRQLSDHSVLSVTDLPRPCPACGTTTQEYWPCFWHIWIKY